MNNIERLGIVSTISLASIGAIGLIDKVDAATTVYTTTATINMRTGPGTNYKSLGLIYKGLDIGIVSFTNNGWAKLENGNYVCSKYIVKNNQYSSNITYKYTKYNLNLRKGPSTNYNKLTIIPSNTKVQVLETSGQWAKVKYNGYIGWCSAIYLNNIKTSTNNNITKQIINKIVVNRNQHIMYCYSNNALIKTFSCAVGKSSTPTPTGTYKVTYKQKNRPYYSKGIAGGDPRNPLGTRWIQFKGNAYAIHGNNNESSIGKSVSNGCIRLHNNDVEWLYERVKEGYTTIIIY